MNIKLSSLLLSLFCVFILVSAHYRIETNIDKPIIEHHDNSSGETEDQEIKRLFDADALISLININSNIFSWNKNVVYLYEESLPSIIKSIHIPPPNFS